MNAKENSRPAGGTTGAGETETAAGMAHDSYTDSTTSGEGRQQGFIADLLLYGPENGQTIADLERLTGKRSREIRKAIESERRSGVLIISDNAHGYYLTDDPAEAQRFARSMEHRAREILRTARAVKRAAGGGEQCRDPA